MTSEQNHEPTHAAENATEPSVAPEQQQDSSRRTLVLVLLLLVIWAAISLVVYQQMRAPAEPQPQAAQPQAVQASNPVQQILERRETLDATIWADEVLAQRHDAVFVDLWDRLRGSSDRWQVLGSLPFDSIRIGSVQDSETLDWDITIHRYGEPTEALTHEQFVQKLEELADRGYVIHETEWHHAAFERGEGDQGPQSTFTFGIHAEQPEQQHRVLVKGAFEVQWDPASRDQDVTPRIRSVAVTDLKVMERRGPVVFEKIELPSDITDPYNLQATPLPELGPLAVYDVTGNALPDIVYYGVNLLYRNLGHGEFAVGPLTPPTISSSKCAVIGDFTGDGIADMIQVAPNGRLVRFDGSRRGVFTTAPQIVSEAVFQMPFVLTAGDIDGDGDLDLFQGQYLTPYKGGQMPEPYYDALDGPPDALLINDGTGKFTEVTEERGLGPKRHRRTFSSSFVDLDDDGDLDLVVVADFAGVDLYENDGAGYFTDVTDELISDRYNFGMSHNFGDFDKDGQLDMMVIGMSSTTARRLTQMGLGEQIKPDIADMRMKMGYGNKMYLRRGDRYEIPSFNDSVARSGWSWGSTNFDFDNDADRDMFIANGHRSGTSAKDYCSTFWRHDVYDESAEPNPVLDQLFRTVQAPLNDNNESWNGYENNVLLMNLDGEDFVNVAYLLGASSVYDSRSAVATDLNLDGRVDLITNFIYRLPNQDKHYLQVYLNRLENDNHWIGVQLREHGDGYSPHGAKVIAYTPEGRQVQVVVSGDSYGSQHPPQVHFGLGKQTTVEKLEVHWPNGDVSEMTNPPVDRYYSIKPPRSVG